MDKIVAWLKMYWWIPLGVVIIVVVGIVAWKNKVKARRSVNRRMATLRRLKKKKRKK